jgi:lactate dehydrogenase-like 2-hydroxyacid dehydrogenase
MLSITTPVKTREASMTRPDLLQLGSYPAWDQDPLDAAFTVHKLFEASDKTAYLAKVGPKIRAIATRGDLGASAAIIAACPALEIISVYGVGTDAVDFTATRPRGIKVTNTPDVLTGDVADLALAMALALTRNIPAAEAWARTGEWAKSGFPLQRRFFGRKAGVLGLGRIGLAIAQRLEGFGMDIAYSARHPKPGAEHYTYLPDPVALAAHSDFLFVTLAATPETRHIVNAKVLAALGPDGSLINISRAANVDEDALLAALKAQNIAGAALDIFEGEPAYNPRFLTLPNLLMQPHVGSGTFETRKAMGQLMRDNLTAHFAGRPLLTPVA